MVGAAVCGCGTFCRVGLALRSSRQSACPLRRSRRFFCRHCHRRGLCVYHAHRFRDWCCRRRGLRPRCDRRSVSCRCCGQSCCRCRWRLLAAAPAAGSAASAAAVAAVAAAAFSLPLLLLPTRPSPWCLRRGLCRRSLHRHPGFCGCLRRGFCSCCCRCRGRGRCRCRCCCRCRFRRRGRGCCRWRRCGLCRWRRRTSALLVVPDSLPFGRPAPKRARVLAVGGM